MEFAARAACDTAVGNDATENGLAVAVVNVQRLAADIDLAVSAQGGCGGSAIDLGNIQRCTRRQVHLVAAQPAIARQRQRSGFDIGRGGVGIGGIGKRQRAGSLLVQLAGSSTVAQLA
ncbi:MAG: hypothetical protein EOO28_30235 [Comamonadaceae bacterium]|nr:MAG: hypothetical protein EOO28_30235 [Comamonadaceae bacterium]